MINIDNKISLSTGTLYSHSLARILDLGQRAGFENFELMLRPLTDNAFADTWDINYLRKLESEMGVKFTSIHPPVDFEKDPAHYIEPVIALTRNLGLSDIVLHAPRNNQDIYPTWFAEFVPTIDNYTDLTFLIENMGTRCLFQGVEDFSPFKNLCFDVSHCMNNQQNPVSLVQSLPRIKQIHLSYGDNHFSLEDHAPLVQQILGNTLCRQICLELRPESFADLYNDENVVTMFATNLEIIKDCLALRQLLID